MTVKRRQRLLRRHDGLNAFNGVEDFPQRLMTRHDDARAEPRNQWSVANELYGIAETLLRVQQNCLTRNVPRAEPCRFVEVAFRQG